MRLVNICRRNRLEREDRDEALKQLYDALKIELHMYVLRRVKASDVEDVLQETWKAICENIQKFRGKTDKEFLKWCYVIAMRKAADSHHGRERTEFLPDEELNQLLDDSCDAKTISAEDRLDLEYALKLLSKSKPECRELLWNHYVLDLDIADLAEELKLKYDAARVRINRCLDFAQGLI